MRSLTVCTQQILLLNQIKETRLVGRVKRIGRMRNVHKIFVRKPRGAT